MTEKISPACIACAHHHIAAPLSCSAYPSRIPEEILSGRVSHRTPWPGDRGIRFRRDKVHPAYFIISGPPDECLFCITTEGTCERYVPVMGTWEDDDEFIQSLLESGLDFREIDVPEAEAFIESARMQREAINPCSLQFRQMIYQRTRNEKLQ